MAKERFPLRTRYELRDYLTHSEVLFSNKFHGRLLSRLSPPLQASVASWLLGKRIVKIPFFSYAKASALQLVVGRKVVVSPDARGRWGGGRADANARTGPDADPEIAEAEAVILRIKPDMSFDVLYVGSRKVEIDVPLRRIETASGELEVQQRAAQVDFESNALITSFAGALESAMFMARDTIIQRGQTLNDRIYLIEKGSVIQFGRNNPLNPLAITRTRDGGFFGDDVAALVAGHAPQPRWYTAKCGTITWIHSLSGANLLSIVTAPGVANFRKYIARYGVWTHLKYEALNAFKSGRLQGDILTSWLDGTGAGPDVYDRTNFHLLEGATPALTALNHQMGAILDILKAQQADIDTLKTKQAQAPVDP